MFLILGVRNYKKTEPIGKRTKNEETLVCFNKNRFC